MFRFLDIGRVIPGLIPVLIACFIFAPPAKGQQPVVVQPGAPGQPSKRLPATTRGILPPSSSKNVEFVRGMLMHHAQAIEMTDLIEARTGNKDIRALGHRISGAQADEIKLMKLWLAARGETVEAESKGSAPAAHHHGGSHAAMPGMLTPKQMEALKAANGAEFDRLFLEGMIQHHFGALDMVKDLFETPGAGQDVELFSLAREIDNDQRVEIRTMQTLLREGRIN